MVLFVGPENFEQELHTTFKELCADPFQSVRQTIACGFFEVFLLFIVMYLKFCKPAMYSYFVNILFKWKNFLREKAFFFIFHIQVTETLCFQWW